MALARSLAMTQTLYPVITVRYADDAHKFATEGAEVFEGKVAAEEAELTSKLKNLRAAKTFGSLGKIHEALKAFSTATEKKFIVTGKLTDCFLPRFSDHAAKKV